MRASHLVARLAAVAALAIPVLAFGLAEAAHAKPALVSVESRCGFAEITIDSDIATSMTANFYGDGGNIGTRPVAVGANVYRLMADPGDVHGVITIADGPGAGNQWHPFTYEHPEGCLQAHLSAQIEHACDGSAVVTVINSGEAPAEGVFFARPSSADLYQTEVIVEPMTVPVGETRFAADGLGNTSRLRTATVRWGDTFVSGTRYGASTECVTVPQVSVTDTCTGVDIAATPADAAIESAAFGRTTAERPVSGNQAELADGESVLVRSGGTLITAHQFTRAACQPVPAPSTPATQPVGEEPGTPTAAVDDTLAVTGLPTAAIVGTGLVLVLLGLMVSAAVRRRGYES